MKTRLGYTAEESKAHWEAAIDRELAAARVIELWGDGPFAEMAAAEWEHWSNEALRLWSDHHECFGKGYY